jgi:hypothetical protein
MVDAMCGRCLYADQVMQAVWGLQLNRRKGLTSFPQEVLLLFLLG